jgi:hypothetical protein
MGFALDFGGVSTSIGGPGSTTTVGLIWDQEIGQNQWYRLSIALDTPEFDGLPGAGEYYVNPPGTLLTVVSEQFGIQGDKMQYTQLTLRNDSDYQVPESATVAVIFTLNVISTPSRQ